MRTRKIQTSPRNVNAATQELAPPYSPWSCNVKVSYASDVCNDNFLYSNGDAA